MKIKSIFAMGMSIMILFSAQSIAFANYDYDDYYEEKVKTVTAKDVTINDKDAAKITGINVDWISGKVSITKSTTKEIKIVEKAYIMPAENKKFTYKIENKILYIDQNIDKNSLSVITNSEKDFEEAMREIEEAEMDLEVYLPEKEYNSFVFNTVSGEYRVWGLSVKTLNSKSVNGGVYSSGMNVDTWNATTVNGDINIGRTVSVNNVKLEAINGDIVFDCEEMPKSFSASIINGDVEVTLPENEGFTIPDYNRCDFESEFALTSSGNKKMYKNGKFLLNITGVNGDIELKRLKDVKFQ